MGGREYLGVGGEVGLSEIRLRIVFVMVSVGLRVFFRE